MNGRPELWRSALADVGDHPLLGSGAGTFEQYWNEHRPRNYVAKDAHSLYLERLAEQGPVGLALILALVLYPLGVAVRYRRDPVALTAVGALVAFTVHAGFDWDWEMPAVTGLALVWHRRRSCSRRAAGPSPALEPVEGRTGGRVRSWWARSRSSAEFKIEAIASSGDAAARGDYAKAESDARRAMAWASWYQGWMNLAAALVGQGRRGEAAAALRTATQKDPVDWIAWRRLADQTADPERFHALQVSAELNPKATRRSLSVEDRKRLGLTGNHG